MVSHPERDEAPPFRIKILRQYKDSLSRQIGEAIAILLSEDSLLNSKNEYIQNCISRITVEEDQLARKKRLIEEELDEKREEEKVQEFKKLKRPTKRRKKEAPTGWKVPKRRRVEKSSIPQEDIHHHPERDVADPPEGEVGSGGEASQKHTSNMGTADSELASSLLEVNLHHPDQDERFVADPPVREVGSGGEASHKHTSYMGPPVGHGAKLKELRQRMESEKRRVIEYLDNKRETEILQDVAEFWVRQKKRVLMKEESQKGWKMFAQLRNNNKKIAKTPKRKSKKWTKIERKKTQNSNFGSRSKFGHKRIDCH